MLFQRNFFSHWISLKCITISNKMGCEQQFTSTLKIILSSELPLLLGKLWESAICLLNKKRCAFELPVQKKCQTLRMGPGFYAHTLVCIEALLQYRAPQWEPAVGVNLFISVRMEGEDEGMGEKTRAGQMKEIAGVGTAGTLRDWVDWWLTVWRIVPDEIDLRIPLWTHNYSRLRSWDWIICFTWRFDSGSVQPVLVVNYAPRSSWLSQKELCP